MVRNFKILMMALALGLGLALAPVGAHAQSSSSSTSGNDFGNVGGMLCTIVQAITGKIGRAIATIAVVFLGIGAFFGKVTWGLAVAVSIGIFAIFGAATIVNAFGGSGSSC